MLLSPWTSVVQVGSFLLGHDMDVGEHDGVC